MAHIAFPAERPALSSLDAARESDSASESEKNSHFSADDFDFPPTVHPGRELFTFSLFVLVIMTLAVLGGWKLISFL